ncbi:19418_t:CDS:1, partial [Rhizophagus irregularis]
TKSRFPYAICGKPTGSSSGQCQFHIGRYYQNRYENRFCQRIRAISVLSESESNSIQ